CVHSFMFLMEVSAYNGSIRMLNVAGNGIADQSSTIWNSSAQNAIDGKRMTEFNLGSCSLTDMESDPWWKVDLGNTFKIHSVIITSSNMIEYSLDGIEVWINKPDPNENSIRCGRIHQFPVSRSWYVSCDNKRGRFVTLRLYGNRNLSLCEVKVYTTEYDYPQPNVAVKGQAVQSSTLYPAAANRAIDGRRDTYYTESSCSHTQEETAPWWRVDLGQIFVVSTIKVTNRGDCCPERLDGAQIHIGNSLQNNGNNNPRCATITHIPLGDTFSFTCESGKMTGRYVNLVLPGDKKILTLCEVEVDGYAVVLDVRGSGDF
uniref:Fucolectin tachylectin-4 pentraxin-1 domain-containing protein n=1 Tax=Periophthalmus magnuspinnatus TaxID=409849 RepID=A0A3B3ZRW1_9GOBI